MKDVVKPAGGKGALDRGGIADVGFDQFDVVSYASDVCMFNRGIVIGIKVIDDLLVSFGNFMYLLLDFIVHTHDM